MTKFIQMDKKLLKTMNLSTINIHKPTIYDVISVVFTSSTSYHATLGKFEVPQYYFSTNASPSMCNIVSIQISIHM